MKTEKEAKPSAQERLHHPYSPSKLQMLESCPKYASSFNENPAALMGTAQHDMADSGVDNDKVPDYRAMAVVECMKFVDERRAKYPGSTLIKEEYLPIDDLVIKDAKGVEFKGTTAGYLDVGIVSADETEAEVIDFKFGQVAVEPAGNNLQGMSYMLGLRKRFPKIKTCVVWFMLPHRDEIDGYAFDLSEERVSKIYLRIRTVVNRAIEANKDPGDFSTARPNVSACLFCDLVGRCPKVTEIALNVGKKYSPLRIPESISTTVFTDPAQIKTGLELSAVIKVWAEAYRTQVTNKTIDDQKFIPDGYMLVQNQKRKILKPKALGDFAKTFLPPEHHEKVEALYDIALGGLEDLISTAAPRGEKEKTVDQFSEKALEAGLMELGTPFAFLRQSKKPAEPKK